MRHHHLRIAPNAVASFSGKPSLKTLAAVKKLAELANSMTVEQLRALEKKRPFRSESQLQEACFKWFRLAYPQYSMLLFAIPNGGFREKAEGAALKRQGVVKGVADVLLSIPKIITLNQNNDFKLKSVESHGIYIELKVGKNTMSKEQEQFAEDVIKQGYRHQVIRSFDEFKILIEEYLK